MILSRVLKETLYISQQSCRPKKSKLEDKRRVKHFCFDHHTECRINGAKHRTLRRFKLFTVEFGVGAKPG